MEDLMSARAMTGQTSTVSIHKLQMNKQCSRTKRNMKTETPEVLHVNGMVCTRNMLSLSYSIDMNGLCTFHRKTTGRLHH